MEKELTALGRIMDHPARPLLAIMGGSKVSDKIGIIRHFFGKADAILIGGAMTFTFLKAMGVPIGNSRCEEDKLELANELRGEAAAAGTRLLLPLDHLVAAAVDADAECDITQDQAVPDGKMGLDIGPETVAAYTEEIRKAKTILWNGPMGVFELEPFASGTLTLAEEMADAADHGAFTGDISAPMIARARERAGAASAAEFILADAATHVFAPASFDALVSRFGVMFFVDPVASFANLRKGLAHGGRVVFACWREAKRNPWQMIALKAACKHVPRLPDIGPEDPSPFSFADEARVRRVLGAAGFEKIALTPVDLELDVAAGQGLEAALGALQQIGAASRALEGQPEALRAAAVAEMRAALAPHQRGPSVLLGAAIWIVEAVNP